jgi:hypothetical protein
MTIRYHGQSYLRPPGLEPITREFGDQEQTGTPAPIEDGTFIQDEDGFVLSGDEDDGDGDDYEDEDIDQDGEDEQVYLKSRILKMRISMQTSRLLLMRHI